MVNTFTSRRARRKPPAGIANRDDERRSVKSFDFVTTIPLNRWMGTGCYVGVETLAAGVKSSGHNVSIVAPRIRVPGGMLRRLTFNHSLRSGAFARTDVVIGVDADGYTIAGRHAGLHIAAIKGVIGDVLEFEPAWNRPAIAWHARLERLHAQRADIVMVPSQYCADRVAYLYGVQGAVVVPEAIDLAQWRTLRERNPSSVTVQDRFVVLCVCRLYPRKNVGRLLQAIAQLLPQFSDIELRIVGAGPQFSRLRRLTSELRLDKHVRWLGNVDTDELAREYNSADAFCLPSLQEGFGIVFLEAMAAGLPIVAARSSAIPEVVSRGILVPPTSSEALAEALLRLARDTALRKELGEGGRRAVEQFDAPRVTQRFLDL